MDTPRRTRRSLFLAAVLTAAVALTTAIGIPATSAATPGTVHTVPGDGATFTVAEEVEIGEAITLSGSGWTDAAGTQGSVVAVKLDEGEVHTTEEVTHPLTGELQKNPAIYALVAADAQGNWEVSLPFPTLQNSNVQWATGETHSVRLLTGSLREGDTTRSVTASFTLTENSGGTDEEQPSTGMGEPEWPHQTLSTGTDSDRVATAWVEDEVSTATGSTLRLRGTGWLTSEGTPSTVAVKLNFGASELYSRSGSDIIDHPSASGDTTIWVLLVSTNPTGNPNVRTIGADGSFDVSIDLPDGLTAGQYLTLTLLSGRFDPTDVRRSLTTDFLSVAGQRYVPEDEETTQTTCTASTATPTVSIDTPSVALGGVLTVSGTGWCHPDEGAGASVIAVKIDEGAYSHTPGSAVASNATIWAVIDDADPATGDWTAQIQLPDGTDSTSIPALPEGTHRLRLLTGSLKAGDAARSVLSGEFVVGAYRPSSLPTWIDPSTTLDATNAASMSVSAGADSLTVTLPSSHEGDWVYLTAYDSAGWPQYPWGETWFRVDSHHRVHASLQGVTLPEGQLRLVAQSGNAGSVGTVIGWVPLQGSSAQTPTATTGEAAPSTSPTATTSTESLSSSLPGIRMIRSVAQVDATASAPTSIPGVPVEDESGLVADNAGRVGTSQEGSVVTLTLADGEPGDWAFLYLYPGAVPVGWVQLDDGRQVRVDLAGLTEGEYRLAALDREGELMGWTAVSLGEGSGQSGSSTRDTGSADAGTSTALAAVGGTPAGSSSVLGDADWWLLAGGALAAALVAGAALARARRERAASGREK